MYAAIVGEVQVAGAVDGELARPQAEMAVPGDEVLRAGLLVVADLHRIAAPDPGLATALQARGRTKHEEAALRRRQGFPGPRWTGVTLDARAPNGDLWVMPLPRSRLFLLAILLFALLLPPVQTHADESPPAVRIGVLAFLGDDASGQAWFPLLDHLQHRLPGYRFSLVQLNHDGLERAVTAGELEFVITNPGHYVELEARHGASLVLTLDRGDAPAAERALGSVVIAPRQRASLRELPDLRGQRLAVVGKEGFGGYQLVWRELLAAGLEPERDLAGLLTLGLPMDRVLAAVERGDADAGVLRACVLEQQPDWQTRFRVVGARSEPGFPCVTSTRLYPDWPFARLRGTPPALGRELALALLAMDRQRDGLAWAVPADYQSVHALFRELQIGPYKDLQPPTVMMLAERYWPWVAGFALLVVAWVLYTVHVERLVDTRTAALRAVIEERQQLAADMRASQERADHLARLSVLGELSGTLAHELNQPLATIANYAGSLIRRLDGHRLTDDAVREAAGEMATQAERAADILARIRGFSRKRRMPRAAVSPREMVDEAVALFRGMLGGAPRIDIASALPPGLAVEMDALQIQQVLLNLLKNGYDASRSLPAERQALALRLEQADDLLLITVRDHGSGMDDETRRQLFEPFFTTKPEGLGLGLAICRSIAEAHGGHLTAAPAADGFGSEFTLSLPLNASGRDAHA